MRPLRLEVEGFMPYRDPIEVDLEGADYFALVGPTGSGKSSIIDAMTFALYGRIPRLDARSVEPLISKGLNEARVRLDFTVGSTTYTAVRVVRRVGAGASTKEARLEQGETVLAGDADGLSAAVEALLGLRYEEFTRCVVLPQGDFARFMHDKPADRGDLLTRLLDLGVYERVGQRATKRADTAEGQLSIQRVRLEQDLSFATPEALADVRARIEALTALKATLDTDVETLDELRTTVAEAKAEAADAARAAEALGSIAVPVDLETLGEGQARARADLTAATAALTAATEAVTIAERASDALPDRAAIAGAVEAHAQLATATDDAATAQEAISTLEGALARAAERAAGAEASVRLAEEALEAARVADRASDLRRTLEPGAACPVCGQEVHDVPHVEAADIDRSLKAVEAARTELAAATEGRSEQDRLLAAARARHATLDERVAALRGRVAAFPDAEAARALLDQVVAADETLKAARASETRARAAEAGARATVEAADASLKAAWAALDAARDRVAAFGPPASARDDLKADWGALAAWAAERAGLMKTAAASALQRAEEATERGTAIRARQLEACAAAGIDNVTDPRDDCLKALADAEGAAANIAEALERAAELRAHIEELSDGAAVAKALGNHLKANAFERWILGQALTQLTEGATQILLELSGGQYSLSIDKNHNFAVVDHRNADAKRSAKTLSGGETFLASLALALAMSDRIAQLSAHSGARLESIFLDEGFGTLDPETLEVVRAAIETLAARNRTVGIVTHVRALAEEIPIRFEVRKGPSTSTVDRILA